MTTTNTSAPAINGKQVQQQQPDNANTEVAKPMPSPSERFTAAVAREFGSNVGELNITSFQKKLIQNYFIKIDMVLKAAEAKRMAKAEKYRDPLAFTWENVNLPRLAVDVITYSSVGLDPAQPNHINPIPFKNTSSNKFDFTFIMGFKGIELKAKKYGLDVPDDVVVELVYSNDLFKQIKKDINNKVEGYTFEVVNDFERGEIVGGFYYHKYFNAPERNKLRVFSWKDIEKRKPEYASAEFWGGEKDKWEYSEEKGKNVKVGKETVEGWKDEMAYKTICRAAYNAITIDSEKIDEHYLNVIQKERDQKDLAIFKEIDENANRTPIGFVATPPAGVDENTGEVTENIGHTEVKPELPESTPALSFQAKEPVQQMNGQQQPSGANGQQASLGGPGF